ncbi:MAG: hypothetical protein O3A00_24145, partial [Planctomycetota bacterium]|nr:hypothetical protein [Planctomycetota bacterium]
MPIRQPLYLRNLLFPTRTQARRRTASRSWGLEKLEDRTLLSAIETSPVVDVDQLPEEGDLPEEGPFPLSDTFKLHSQRDSEKTIYLDFNGHTTSGTPWNTAFNGGADFVTPAYSLDGDSAFNDTELERIQFIWQRVSEDFIPFDVNVTTQEPNVDDLINAGGSDSRWGVRVAIGGNSQDWFGNSAGGVAYPGSFRWNTDT